VVATGDELVPIDQTPQEGQIRNSNETMLLAQCRRAGTEAVPLGIARDDRAHLREKIEAGLEHDILLLSGGVSAGKLDLVPPELESTGVRKVFHKVHLKPGKPIWFGVFPRSGPDSAETTKRGCYVFALPGNPVSSMVCFELFARTAIRRLMGLEPADPQPVRARLAEEFVARGNRPTYHPAQLEENESGPVVHPVK
jgi:molybdopterin molybdotransferase